MRIGIFSKFEMSGGSEFRCVELANAISRADGHEGILLAERGLPDRVRSAVGPHVRIQEGVFSSCNPDAFYSLDRLVIVNTDSSDFTRVEYWHGETARHSCRIDLSRVKSMAFLFNYVVSPSRFLTSIQDHVFDIRIITANTKFFREISDQDRYELVRHFPRLMLESPIDPASIAMTKSASPAVRFGAHSKPVSSKWNSELRELIATVNQYHGDRVAWDFMGMPDSVARTIRNLSNVTVRREFSLSVGEFLSGVDVFVYYLGWDREEPWSRSAAEALASGCPVITTSRGGNVDQVVHGNNGYLCRTKDDFVKYSLQMVEHRERRDALSRNAIRESRRFHSDNVVRRLIEFLE